MESLVVCFILALAANGVVSRPQSDNNENLEDRYGFIIPGRQQFPGQFPGQGFPGQFPNQGFPGQFPGQGFPGQFPGQGFPGQGFPTRPTFPTQPSVTPATGPSTTSSAVRDCVQACPVTSEYNPVCGSDNIVYPNAGRLQCAQSCGVNVSLLRAAPCPPTTPAPVA